MDTVTLDTLLLAYRKTLGIATKDYPNMKNEDRSILQKGAADMAMSVCYATWPDSERRRLFASSIDEITHEFKIFDPITIAYHTRQEQKPEVVLKLRRKAETDEWVVRVYINGKYNEDASYYTDDKKDAEDTMKAMRERYNKKIVK